MNRKVGLGVLTPPPGLLDATDGRGAVGTPRHTRLGLFMVPMRVQSWKWRLPTNHYVAEGILPPGLAAIHSCVWIVSTLSPPGWKPRLYGRQDARRYGSEVQRANMDFGEFSPQGTST